MPTPRRSVLFLAHMKSSPPNSEENAAAKAVELCRNGRATALMKGSLHTDLLMHTTLQKDTGLGTSRRFGHGFVLDAPL